MGLSLLRRGQPPTQPGRTLSKRLVSYQMRQQAAVLGGDFWIEDQYRRHVYRIDGTRSGSRTFMDLENAHGDQLCRIRTGAAPPWAVEIEEPDGALTAVAPHPRLTLSHQGWTVEVASGPSIAVRGRVADHEYTVLLGGQTVAAVSRRWFKAPHTYGVQLAPGEDPVLLLAISVALDVAAHRIHSPVLQPTEGTRPR